MQWQAVTETSKSGACKVKGEPVQDATRRLLLLSCSSWSAADQPAHSAHLLQPGLQDAAVPSLRLDHDSLPVGRPRALAHVVRQIEWRQLAHAAQVVVHRHQRPAQALGLASLRACFISVRAQLSAMRRLLAHLRRYCGVSMNCRILLRKAALLPTVPGLQRSQVCETFCSCFQRPSRAPQAHAAALESSTTTTSSRQKMAAALASWPATRVASSCVWATCKLPV